MDAFTLLVLFLTPAIVFGIAFGGLAWGYEKYHYWRLRRISVNRYTKGE